jgi:hypothetical protein
MLLAINVMVMGQESVMNVVVTVIKDCSSCDGEW